MIPHRSPPRSNDYLQKLIKRLIWKDHIAILMERQNELLTELADLTKEGFAKAQEEWEKSVAIWGMQTMVCSSPLFIALPREAPRETQGRKQRSWVSIRRRSR